MTTKASHKEQSPAMAEKSHEGHLDSHEEIPKGEVLFQESHNRLLEVMKSYLKESSLPEKIQKRLEMDFSNKTADYSRINLTEVYYASNYNVDAATSHWRLAKIMDAMTLAYERYKIIGESDRLDRQDIPRLYNLARQKKLTAKTIKVKVKNPSDPQAQTETVNASFADMAYLMDLLKINRELGPDELPLQSVLYNYFKGQRLVANVRTGADLKTIDLMDQKINPKDDYEDLNINHYEETLRDSQMEMQQLGDFREISQGHREFAGHSYSIKWNGQLFWLPMSGEMAQFVTKEDMQKMSERGATSMIAGHPQEFGDMEEDTGVLVRARADYLWQRKSITNSNQLNSSTTIRVKKLQAGIGPAEEAKELWEPKREGMPDKRAVYLCGKNLESGQIRGIHNHYDRARLKMGLPKLTDEQAADIAFKDLFAPLIINNWRDWLVSLSRAHNVSSPTSIVNRTGEFDKFVLYIMCLDLETGEFRWHDFKNMDDLENYIYKRIELGKISQNYDADTSQLKESAKQPVSDKESKLKSIEKLTPEQGKRYGDLIAHLLGDYKNYLTEFIGGKDNFLAPYDEKKNKVPAGQLAEGQTIRPFYLVIRDLLDMEKEEDFLLDHFKKIFPELEQEDFQEFDLDDAKDSFADSLHRLSQKERKKIINPK